MEMHRYLIFVRIVGLMTVAIGILVLTGWFFETELLKRVFYCLVSMKFNTAICFVSCGLALWFTASNDRIVSNWSKVLALFVLAISLSTLAQSMLHVNLFIDELFVEDLAVDGSRGGSPGRMAPTTAFCFIFIACSFFILDSKSTLNRRMRSIFLYVVTLISFLAILGYLYQVPLFYELSFFTPMALHTALCFLALSVALLLLNPNDGLTAIFTGKGIGNMMARRIFPLVTIIVVGLGFLRITMHRYNLVSVELGIALYAFSFVVLSLFIIVHTAIHLNKVDRNRSVAENSLVRLNKQLEDSIEQRTKESRESEQKFRETFQMSPVGLIMSDLTTGKFLQVNKSFRDITGFTNEDVIGRTGLEVGLMDAEQRDHHRNVLMTQGFLNDRQATYFTKSGEERHSLISVRILDFGDEKIGLTALYDINELKEQETELREAKDAAEQASVAKERFMANMSHEIRTPMNAILGFAEIIERGPLTEEQRQYMKYIRNSGDNLLVLINDILDYSKIEAGMMQLEAIPFNLFDTLSSVRMMFAQKAAEKGLQLVLKIDPETPKNVVGDPTRLNQILVNLIGNAIKFTLDGSVCLEAKVIDRQSDRCKLSVVVTDTGIGIPLEKQSLIFERFTQASEETTRNYGGTGLGLSIAKSLVEIQGGEMRLESTEGIGTQFTFTVSYPVLNETASNRGNLVPYWNRTADLRPGLNVLVVEDNMMNQILAKRVLADFGCEVDVAENGLVALQRLKERDFDIILMDIQMPEMDGYLAAEKIRNELKSSVPIIAMTANVMSDEREKCLVAGMDDYISKPFKSEVLRDLIAKHTTANG